MTEPVTLAVTGIRHYAVAIFCESNNLWLCGLLS